MVIVYRAGGKVGWGGLLGGRLYVWILDTGSPMKDARLLKNQKYSRSKEGNVKYRLLIF